jgi:hypothetical protein
MQKQTKQKNQKNPTGFGREKKRFLGKFKLLFVMLSLIKS